MANKKHSESSVDKAEQGRRNQILGDMAEGHVTAWVPQMGFVANPSQKDRTGWDHYLEFSAASPDEANFPPGMPSRALSCKVQVKGVRTGRQRISLKLSTLFNFVQEPIPYFIVVLAYGSNSGDPQRVYLIHIWEEIISKVLERICKLSERERQKLHKKSLSLNLDPQDQLVRPWPGSLRERITRCTGSNLFEYAQKKKQYYETVGFADGYRNFKVTFQAPSADELNERMSRLAIGLEAVEFINFEESRVRFDVSYPLRELPSEPGLMRMPATDQHRSWRIEVLETDLSDPIDLSCTVRSSVSVFPFLPERHWLVRIETRFLDMLVRFATNQLTFSFQGPDADQKVEFSELYWTCRLLERLSSTTSPQMIFRIYREGTDKKNLGFKISTPAVSFPEATRDLIKKVKATWLVFRNLDFDPHMIVSLRELAAMQPAVFILEAVFSRMTMRAEATISERPHFESVCAIVSFSTIQVGENVHVFTVAVTGTPRLEPLEGTDTRVIVESNQPILLQRRTVSPTEWGKFDYDIAVEGAKNLLKRQGIEDTIFIPAPIRDATEVRPAG